MESSGLKVTPGFCSWFFSSLLFFLLLDGLLELWFCGTGSVLIRCSLGSALVCFTELHLSRSSSGMRRGVRTGAELNRKQGGSGSRCSS